MLDFIKRIFSSKSGTQFSLYGRFILPLYFKFFVKNCFFCRTMNYIKFNSNKNSLINKIGSDVNKGLILLFFLASLIHYIIYHYFIKIEFMIYISGLSLIVFLFILAFFNKYFFIKVIR